MNNKKPIPSAILCYAPEDDWLARSIADGIEEKEFYIQLSAWCVRNGRELWQKIKETTHEHTYLLVLLTKISIAKLWNERDVDEDRVNELNSRLIPIVHGLSADAAPQALQNITVHEIGERCDVSALVEHIKKLNTNPNQPCMSHNRSDSFPELSATKIDALFIVQNFLFRDSEFQIETVKVVEGCEWNRTRVDSAIKWLESRGLVKIEGSLIVGERPSIDCFTSIVTMNTLKNNGIAGRCLMARSDSLLLKREEFEGKIFNAEGSFELTLTASADRSGKIVLEVEPVPRSLETERQLLFVHSGKVNLGCVGVNKRNRKLMGHNVQFRGDINKEPFPIWLEPDKVVITDKDKNTNLSAKNNAKITLCLSEFDCLSSVAGGIEGDRLMPPPIVENLGYLTLCETQKNWVKNRTNKRITATLSITAASEIGDISEWKKGVSRFMQRLIPVLEFAQGGKLVCPITELYEGNGVETYFLPYGESDPQFMPAIQRGEDLKSLIVKVIENDELSDDEWQGIEEAIGFALSAPNYGEARLLLNLIAIEGIVKTFGGSSLGKLKSFLESRKISSIDIKNDDIKKLIDARNDLAHECKFSGSKEELARLFALSHEVFTRIMLNIFDFSGWYCSYTCERGVRIFPECSVVSETSVSTISFLMHVHRWKSLVEQKDSRVSLHLPS